MPEHVRERITRLEWATRFRPLHIQRVLLVGAPPASLPEFFYSPAEQLESASWGARFFRAVMEGAGVVPAAGKSTESMLAEFQRHGLYLAYAHECPVSETPPQREALAATVARRLRFSYKPKSVLPLDGVAHAVCAALAAEQVAGVEVRIPSSSLQPPAESGGDWAAFSRALAAEIRSA